MRISLSRAKLAMALLGWASPAIPDFPPPDSLDAFPERDR